MKHNMYYNTMYNVCVIYFKFECMRNLIDIYFNKVLLNPNHNLWMATRLASVEI